MSNKVTEDDIEIVGVAADKLVLHRVFEKYQSAEDQEPRYRFTQMFRYHMKQFIRFVEGNPDLKSKALDDDTGIGIMMMALLMYFAANRKLDQSQQNSLEMNMFDLLKEAETVFSETDAYDNSGELVEMTKVVLGQVYLLDMNMN